MTEDQSTATRLPVTVIVIGLNEAENLGRCFSSIVAALEAAHEYIEQSEILYVDSGSSDESISVAKNFADRVFKISKHPTAAAARNVGLENASNEFVLFLDGDMELDKQWFNHSLPVLGRADSSIAGVTGIRNDLFLDETSQRIVRTRLNYYGVNRERRAPKVGGALFVKKSAVDQVGGYPHQLRAWEEPDLHARMTQQGLHIVELPVRFVDHYTPENSDPKSVARRLMSPQGSVVTFGNWFWKAQNEGYLGGFLRVNRSVSTLLAGDLMSAMSMVFGRWKFALLVQLCSHLIVWLTDGKRFVVLARLWVFGIVLTRFTNRRVTDNKLPPAPEYKEIVLDE